MVTLPHRSAPTQASDTWEEERACIARVRQGNESAFASLFRQYYEPLCQFAYRVVRSADTAEEVVQRLFVRLWEQRSALTIEPPIARYLYKATRHEALNAERTQRRLRTTSIDEARMLSSSMGEAESDDRTLSYAIDRAVAQLPEQCRLVFVLNREHHMSYAEIAEVLGISHNTVKTQMARALMTLRETLASQRT